MRAFIFMQSNNVTLNKFMVKLQLVSTLFYAQLALLPLSCIYRIMCCHSILPIHSTMDTFPTLILPPTPYHHKQYYEEHHYIYFLMYLCEYFWTTWDTDSLCSWFDYCFLTNSTKSSYSSTLLPICLLLVMEYFCSRPIKDPNKTYKNVNKNQKIIFFKATESYQSN